MKTLKVFTACIASSLFLLSCDKNKDNEMNGTDQTFMMQASLSNTAETGAATLALSKATSPQVKSFAQQMVNEHSQAQNDLKAVGTAVGVTVRDTLDPAHIALMATLNTLSGRKFDSTYIHAQVTDHQVTQANFQNEISNGNHITVKSYANTYMPHIQAHLTRADSIATKLF